VARADVKPAAISDLLASKLRLVGVAVVCAKVALVPVVFDYSADFPFPVAKALLSHALAYLLAGVLVGLAVQFRRALFVWSWIHVPVVAFLAANVIATVFAPDRLVALYGTHTRMLGLGTLADFVLLYFAVALLVRTRAETFAIIASGLAASVVVLAYELVQFIGKDPFDWNETGAIRPFSTLGQTTTLAEYLTVLAVGAVALALFEPNLRLPIRAALFGYALVLVAGALVTQTRSALVGIIAGAALVVLMTWLGHPSRQARLITLIGATAATAMVTLVLVLTPLGARVLATVEPPGVDVTGGPGLRLEASADTRIGLYEAALRMVRDRPLLGYGPDNFSVVFPVYRSASEPSGIQQSLPTSAHSWAAQIAATSGLLGLGSFVAIALVAVVTTITAGFRPVVWMAAAMLGAFLGTGVTTISDVGTDWLFWASAGAIAAATGHPGDGATARSVDRERPARRTARSPSAVTVVAVALGCAALGLGVLASAGAYWASRSARDSELQRLVGRSPFAITAALSATNRDSGRAEYWNTLGLAYVSGDRIGDAVWAFEHASKLAPYDVRFDGDLARGLALLAQRGDKTSGVRAAEVADRVVQTDPNNPLAHQTRAVVMQFAGNLAEALKSSEHALALDKTSEVGYTTNLDIYVTALQVLNALGRPLDAITLARASIAKAPTPASEALLRLELARALVASGQLKEALSEVDRVLALQPGQPTAQELRAQVLAALAK
jgi:O-antigen ligase